MATCHNYTLGLAKLMPTISAYSSALGEFFGADWYRLDFFYGHPSRGIRVNEVLLLLSLRLLATRAYPPPDLGVISAILPRQVSYPSHHDYPESIRRAWSAGYVGDRMVQVSSNCAASHLLSYVDADHDVFEKKCYLCRPAPPAPPPRPPSPPDPPSSPPPPWPPWPPCPDDGTLRRGPDLTTSQPGSPAVSSAASIASFLLKSSNELGNDDAHSNGGGTPAYASIIDNDPRDDDDDGLLRGDPFAFAGFPDWGEAYFARRRPPCPAPGAGGSTAANGSQPERHAAAQMHTP